jgi:hypothetical protein
VPHAGVRGAGGPAVRVAGAAGYADQAPEPGVLDQVSDAGSRHCRHSPVRAEAAQAHPQQRGVQHSAVRPGAAGHRDGVESVGDVLHSLKPEASEGSVDQSVKRPVDHERCG